MALVIVVMVPLILVFAFHMPEINNTQWTNEQYHDLSHDDLGTGFWYVLGICVLVSVGMLIWIVITPTPVTDDSELFERYDGR